MASCPNMTSTAVAPPVQENPAAPRLPPRKWKVIVPFTKTKASNNQQQQQQSGQKLPTSTSHHIIREGQNRKSTSLPLFIVKKLQPQNDEKGNAIKSTASATTLNQNQTDDSASIELLKEQIKVQKEHLELQKQELDFQKEKLIIEKQRLEFDRLIGKQLLTLIPMVSGLLQKLPSSSRQDTMGASNDSHSPVTVSNKRKRSDSLPPTDYVYLLKDSNLSNK